MDQENKNTHMDQGVKKHFKTSGDVHQTELGAPDHNKSTEYL